MFPASKVVHFNEISRELNVEYEDMVFFDDDPVNIEDVTNLGVKSIFVDNGLNINCLKAHFPGVAQEFVNGYLQS
ncbi:MAG: hypothetical protein HC896_08460 [Bacteroidales bacterium]|nr:hypothetical protein [Bacteroidales bacterium]